MVFFWCWRGKEWGGGGEDKIGQMPSDLEERGRGEGGRRRGGEERVKMPSESFLFCVC